MELVYFWGITPQQMSYVHGPLIMQPLSPSVTADRERFEFLLRHPDYLRTQINQQSVHNQPLSSLQALLNFATTLGHKIKCHRVR